MIYEKKETKLAGGSLTYYHGGTGRPVLYIHSGSGVRMTEPLETLAKSFSVYMPILPGYDGTKEIGGVDDTKALAELLIEFAGQMSTEKWDVMGHSIGGAVAAWIAILAPDIVDQLILTAPGGVQPKDALPLPTDPKKMLAAAYAYPEKIKPDDRTPDVAAKNREMALKYSQGKTRDEDLLGRMGDVKALTLIIQGEQDGIVADGAVQNLRATIPRSHLIYLYGAAHVPEVDQPERFSRLVDDFLTRGEAFIVNWGDRPATV